MKRRALSFDALASKVSKQSNKPSSKVIFNRLSLNEIKKYPEIVLRLKTKENFLLISYQATSLNFMHKI